MLAAGAARRLGRPKQLLPVAGVPLVRCVVENVLAGPFSPVVVVLGAQADEVATALAGLVVHRILNAEWAEGLGSSLRTGVAAALKLEPQLENLIVVLTRLPQLGRVGNASR